MNGHPRPRVAKVADATRIGRDGGGLQGCLWGVWDGAAGVRERARRSRCRRMRPGGSIGVQRGGDGDARACRAGRSQARPRPRAAPVRPPASVGAPLRAMP